jgi:hypothetical protein
MDQHTLFFVFSVFFVGAIAAWLRHHAPAEE